MSFNLLLKLIISAAITFGIVSNYIPKDHNAVLAIASPLATVAAMLFGFIIASVTFFSASVDNVLIQAMKDTKMYSSLMARLHQTGMALISSCIFMVVSIFSPAKKIVDSYHYTWDYTLLIIGFFALVYALIEFWTCWKRVNLVVSKM